MIKSTKSLEFNVLERDISGYCFSDRFYLFNGLVLHKRRLRFYIRKTPNLVSLGSHPTLLAIDNDFPRT